MSSQDKAGSQDGTEDAATEGRVPGEDQALPDTARDAADKTAAEIEDAAFVDDTGSADPAMAGAEAAAADDGALEAGADADAGDATDPEVPDADALATAEDDMQADDQNDDGLAAAALAGTAAGAALGAGAAPADPDPDPEPARRAADPAPAPQKSGGGFMPALLGGVIAAGLGAGGIAYFGQALIGDDDRLEQALAAQDSQLAALDAKLSEMAATLAAPVEDVAGAQIAALGDRLADQFADQIGGVADRIDRLAATVTEVQGGVAALDTRLADANDRLSAVERRPLTESSEAAQAAFAAYEDDIAELRAALDAQTQASEALAAQLEEREAAAQAEIDAAAARAAALQAQAEEQAQIARDQAEEQARIATEQAEARARTAALREALVGLDAALEKGTPFETYLGVLSEDAEVPQPLAEAATSGVATLPDLRAAFPDLARDALDASIRETVDDDLTERAVAFLKAQTGFRSLAPRAGDDPDAVLSRAEAALRAGDLGTAVSELSQLPPAGQAVMADWIARAEQRRNVTEAAETLAATLLAN